jgi:hypothetical protein
MKFLEEVPAVRRIESDRGDLLALEIVGHVTPADAENIFGLLEAACALHPSFDVLVRMTNHDGVDWDAIAAETIEQGKAQGIRHVRRCAAVGKPDWTGSVQSWLEPDMPVEFRHFEAEDEQSAWAWLGARERPAHV